MEVNLHLSRICLNPENDKVKAALVDYYCGHLLIWRAFPSCEDGGPGRILYQLIPEKSKAAIVVSEKEPQWQELLDQQVLLDANHKTYQPHFVRGQNLRFRLRCNPTKKITDPDDNRKIRVGLIREEEQRQWLERKANDHGFTLKATTILGCSTLQTERKLSGKQMKHLSVDFSGELTVTDSNVFAKAIANGIGPAKGFGFGLLTVAPV